MGRESRNAYEKKHKEGRKCHKKAVDIIINTADFLLQLPEKQLFTRESLLKQIDEIKLRKSLADLQRFKKIEECGYGDSLMARYPSMRKYFAEFLHLQFSAAHGSESLMDAICIIRKIDSGIIKKLPQNVPTSFVPKELKYPQLQAEGL